ncbi:MAG: histidinol-phosphate transaminase [Alphaproteobacteria bacterium]|nr:histidinol-phosphate transaminase [Alphaproteobacteria bacterium]MDP6587913.1 histidinol-phosphate transaminase [Alphaproteobacteria bacterium]
MNNRTSHPTPRPGIMGISPYVAGRSSLAGQQNVIRLASNESALGPSPRATAAYEAHGASLHRYPDGGAADLRAALGALNGIDAEHIVCGSGSDEIIQLLTKAYAGPGDEVLYSRHGFLVYELAARAVGAAPVAAPETDLCADVDALLAHVTEKTRLLFLANPNNPTGSYLSAEELRRLWNGLPENIVLVIDAAYAEFVGAADYDASADLVGRAENVVMTRTFSKIYGLASLRLGWCYASAAVIDVMNRVRGPFNVTGPALAAGLAALEDQEHVDKARRHNDKWLQRLDAELKNIGITALPSVGNFVLLRFAEDGGRDSKAADAFLTGRGILARNVDNYHLPDCLRVTIGKDAEMDALLAALTEFMA